MLNTPPGPTILGIDGWRWIFFASAAVSAAGMLMVTLP